MPKRRSSLFVGQAHKSVQIGQIELSQDGVRGSTLENC